MDSGSKCTWYKFIKGEQKQSYLLGDASDRRKDNSALMYCWTPEEHIGNNYLTCAPTLLLVEDRSLIWRVFPSHFLIPFIYLSVCLWWNQERRYNTRNVSTRHWNVSLPWHCQTCSLCVSNTPQLDSKPVLHRLWDYIIFITTNKKNSSSNHGEKAEYFRPGSNFCWQIWTFKLR